ncbi:WD40 repeat-like protein [Aulographum hederae CBS 113979]|uniref:WD40 repeat-like protein n=1 Tax=Aulographum hederae CBS 113979 TaxID=1176131 RepID=A0A6G1HC78_9PEZI|nr:WD40 repeat-like protein [Aulographum hederae CBS 113979]
MVQQRLRGRPAHTPGPTFLSYTPNGTKLVTVGLNNAIRVFQTGSDAEPTNIDNCQDSNTAVVAANEFFITGSEDGTVSKYSLESNTLQEVLVRCTLPVRDVALSPDGEWAAVASDELVVKVVNTEDMTRVLYLRDQAKPVKHVAFDKSGTYLAVSCTDGLVYVYSLSSKDPELVRKVDGLIRTLETDAEASSKITWHPDGRAFAAPTATRDIQIMSQSDWERQRVFKDGHGGDITALAWSPNGALLVSASTDRKLILWDVKTQKILKSYDDIRFTILALSWHPTSNILSYTNNEGELFIHTDFIPDEHISLLNKSRQPAPFIHDPLSEISGNARAALTNGVKSGIPSRHARHSSYDSLDDIFPSDIDAAPGDLNDFIEDDDGAAFDSRDHAINGFGKRPLDDPSGPDNRKRPNGYSYSRSSFQPKIHQAFQPGSTPWRGTRRYLSISLLGIIWTVSQETHYTITVEFYDRSSFRDFHFTDMYHFDKACLNEHGALFACDGAPRDDIQEERAMLMYRPHETWTTRGEYKIFLPLGEKIESCSLSESYIVACTSAGYVRVYTLFGVPVRVWRMKSQPSVTCASWRDYVMTIGNGAVGGDGKTRLTYSIENVKRGEVCQDEDSVGLCEGEALTSVFFSDNGDPHIYTTRGTLLVLAHWRHPSQARWTPLLDTNQLSRLASGKKEESYYPVAVAQDRFHCIILKGGDTYPSFPRPLLSDFEFRIPVSDPPHLLRSSGADDDEDDDGVEIAKNENTIDALEESLVRTSTLLTLLTDLTSATRASPSQQRALDDLVRQHDKTVLRLLDAECRQGDERGMKALEVVGMLKTKNDAMMNAAVKVAGHHGRSVLAEKIREVAERTVLGLDEDEDME